MLVGRTSEIQSLEKAYHSKEAEFIVLYGRRRIGKTFLIREFFGKKKCRFLQATGLQNGTLANQLSHFAQALTEVYTPGIAIKPPSTWDEAFQILTLLIKNFAKNEKIVIFLDELPWMASRRSGLLEALDYYWNHHWSKNNKILLIVCGSSASWLIKNIIYNKGGLHNRCTGEIRLAPFTLAETAQFLGSRNIQLNKNHILEIYMALGGIPYYLKYVENGFSAAENIQKILFDKNSALKDEFKKLFDSLFHEAEAYVEIIQLIAEKKEGISRAAIAKKARLSGAGGRLSQRLKQLEQTHFIQSYMPWEHERGEYYKVVDEFCLFYLYWLAPQKQKRFAPDHWLKQIQKPCYQVWAGYAFEAVCHKHIDHILKALKVKSAETIASWRQTTRNITERGAQIDMLIDRSDDAITICEIKYTSQALVISKAYAESLQNKLNVFKKRSGTSKQILTALISANGVKTNTYSQSLLSNVVTLEAFFKEA